ncbi:tyrosine-protein phosphatase 10D-like isoform X2 [Dreissena polymorpha]|uniref:tyrosine-protein phosphatase 10D-like isoform X2 n=1 Tax=Dreissena polymorpha TaxID=45954 RepID=UPI0022648989|nr:tyrosine-protein phosphatase 10D-like isoform X2 [Dreissena polymorpha]
MKTLLFGAILIIQLYSLYGANLTYSVTEYTINLSWSEPDLNSTYKVIYGVAKESNVTMETVQLPSNNDTLVQHTIYGLYPGQTYSVKIEKDGTNVFRYNITTKPLPVKSVQVTTATSTMATFIWLPSNTSIQDSYQLVLSGNQGNPVHSNEPTALVTGLNPGTSYTVVVQAISGGKVSNASASFTMNTAPSAPKEVKVVALDTQKLNISWKPDEQSNQDGYVVTYTYNSTSVNNEVTVNVTCPTLVDLYCVVTVHDIPGQSYLVQVYSRLGSTISLPLATTHSTKPMSVVSLNEVDTNVTAIRLEWSIDNNTIFQQFDVEVASQNGVLNTTVGPNQSSLYLTGLNSGTLYNVSVYTSTGFERSVPLTKNFYTYPYPVATLTSNLPADVTNSTLTVRWSVQVNAGLDNFSVSLKSGQGSSDNVAQSVTLDKNNLSHIFTNLTAGASYLVTIVTQFKEKTSEPVIKTFRTVPNKPIAVNVVANATEAKVTWQAPVGHVDLYQLTLTSDGTTEPKIVTQTGLSFTLMGLVSGTHYTLKVMSQSGGIFSEAVNTNFTTNPTAVEILRVTEVFSHSVSVTWLPPANTNYTGYQLTIEPSDVTSPVVVNKTQLSHQFTGLSPGCLYVVAVVTVMEEHVSERFAMKVVTSPLPVQDLEAEAFQTGLHVTWQLQNVTTSQSGFVVSYKDSPMGVLSYLPPIFSLPDQMTYSIDILDLSRGSTYIVNVQAWQNVSGVTAGSAVETVNATTKPLPVQNLSGVLVGEDGVALTWSHAPGSAWKYYLVKHRPSLRESNALWVVNTTFTPGITLTSLFPGEQYEIEVYAVSGDVNSDERTLTKVVAPLPPPSVSTLTNQTTASSVKLQWYYNTSATYVERWEISYSDFKDYLQVPTSGSVIEAVVMGLVPGFKYSISIRSEVKGVFSSPVSAYAVTKPINNVSSKFVKQPTNTSFIIDYSFGESDIFDEIVFTLTSPNLVIRRSKSDTPNQVEFSSLMPGKLFTVEVHTVSGEEESETKTVKAQTLPNKAAVSATETATTISLEIQHPTGSVDKYTVTCVAGGQQVKVVVVENITNPVKVTVSDCTPNTVYQCSVATHFGAYTVETLAKVSTFEAAPSLVRNVVAVETAPTQVTLTWQLPQQQNGVISAYMITYVARKDNEESQDQLNVSAAETTKVFNNLRAGYQYTFKVQAITIAAGPAGTAVIELKTYKPSYKDGIDEISTKPRSVSSSVAVPNPHKITVNFSNVFSDKYGEIVAYTVIVSTTDSLGEMSELAVLPGWKEAREKNAKAYQIIANCSNFFEPGSNCNGQLEIRQKRAITQAAYKIFDIGSETSCENRVFCNGPLKPDTTYYVSLRAYTTMQFRDTLFSEAVKTAAIPVKEGSSNVGAIVGGIIAAIIVIAIIILVVLLLRRRSQMKSNMQRHRMGEPLSNRISLTNRKSCCPVYVADFKEHIAYMKADSDFKYAEQFEDLKEIGRGQPVTAAELPCNRGKNRFTNILPYDHSRVKLLPIDDEEGSDYINANYIPGYSSKREYIVSQGPLPATREDFWRMMWEQNVRNIVMLTKCMEKGRERCDRYWPSGSEAVFYGDLQVAVLNETLFPDWTITEFRVSLGEQSRQVRHFHFTTWPDFGVPKKEQVLVRFVRMVREKLFKDAGPIVVHCSAGVGRSGTYVALDRLLQEIKTCETIDIFDTIAQLRRDRVWMVQTEQQYICIHNCLLCVLEGREDEHIYDNVGHSNIAFEDNMKEEVFKIILP